MRIATRAGVVLLGCLPLTGCYVNLYGVQSTSGGTTTTTTASQVSGSARFAGGRIAFSSGQVPPPGAHGGHAYLGKGASAVLITGIVIADLVNYIRGEPKARALPADTRIMETCSCYQRSVNSE